MTEDLLRFAHVVGATVLLGTGAGIAFFMVISNRTRDPRLVAHVAGIVVLAIVLDVVVLGAFLWIKASSDALILVVAAVGIAAIVGGELWLMRSHTDDEGNMHMGEDLEHGT